jgi:DNA polymerase delta subunit 1
MAALNAQVIASRRQQQAITDQATVIVESYDSEEEVLLAWQRLIAREDPDFLCGYNIFGFDFKYMFDRATQLGISDSFCQLGRIRGVTQELVEQKLQSAGLGDNLLHYIQMFGRVLVDLLKVMQRMYQLDNYKLDNVCKQFLNKTKVDVSPREIFIRQKGTDRDRMIVAEYCLIDCVLCNRLMDKLELITNNIGMVQVCPVPISYLFLRGQGIKLFSCVAKVCRAEGFVIPTLESNQEAGDGYEGAIVLEPRTGIHYDVVVVADFNSLYPSCMISENLSHEMFIGSCTVKKGDSTDYRGRPLTDSPYERRLLDGEFPGWDYLDIVYDTYRDMPVAPGRKKTVKTVSGHTICRFAQPPDNAKGVIPKILQNLLDSRGRSKKTRDTFPEGSFRWSLYEGLQLAYKVTANSLYGTMGDSNGKIRMKEIAACTTATGRKLINFSANFVRTHYPGSEIVYGDTDSIFIRFDCRDRFGERLNGLDAVYKSLELCTEAAIQISKQLKRPHNLECEKAIFPFILFSKKRYHGHYYTVYGSPAFKPKSMGIVLKRRDNAQIVKHVFGGMLDIIMREQSIPKAIQFVREECQKVLRGEFPLHMFIITKTLRSYYKRPESIPHNVLAQRIAKRDPGNKPRGNDRVAYAYIKVEGQAELGQGERIETPDYITAHDLRLDYGYYITNQIMNPVTQVLELTGKGARLFDELLTDYHLEQDGARRLTSGFSQFIKIHKKPTN